MNNTPATHTPLDEAEAKASVERIKDWLEKQKQLLSDFQDHSKALELSVLSIKAGNKDHAEQISEYAASLDKYSVALRQSRALLNTEIVTFKSALQEMRRLCLDPDNLKSMAALRELIELSVRLSELKANGALDVVAGFLANKPTTTTETP